MGLPSGTLIKAGAIVLAGNMLSGLMTFGLYGHLKDKKRWGSWKSGATVGLANGAVALLLGGLVWNLGGKVIEKFLPGQPATPALPASTMQGLGSYLVQPLMNQTGMGALVMNQVAGCKGCR